MEMMGKQSVNMVTLLGNEGHLWLFAQIYLLKQQVKAQQAQIDHLE